MLTLVIFAGQVIGGKLYGSLALWTDSVHVATDALAMGIASWVAYKARTHPRPERLRRKGMIASTVLLLLAVGWMAAGAPERYFRESEVNGWGMLVVAFAGAVGNYFQHRIVVSGESHDTTRGLSLHTLTDLASSAIVVIGGVLVLAFGWSGFDPLATLMIMVWIGWCSYRLLDSGGDHDHTH